MYGLQNKRNLPIYDIQEPNLRGYTTTEKNKKQLIDKFPPEDFRNYAEDLIPEDRPQAMDQAPQPQDLDRNFNDHAQAKLAQLNDKFMKFDDDEREKDSDDEEEEQIKATMHGAGDMGGGAGPATAEYLKKGAATATLEDFMMLKIVGKGTFGKVFKVQHMKTQKVYAMKCIRKDVIL